MGHSLLVYLNDIIVFGKPVDEEMNRLRVVFQRLRNANLKLKPKKCVLFQGSVLYLGHIVHRDGISTDPEKIRVIEEWATPTCLRDVRSFLGLASYYRRFVKGFCDIARPLYNLIKKNTAFNWTDQCDEAFSTLKRCLTTSPLLAYPDHSGKFFLDTDASGTGIGAVLSQEQGGHERVIAYASRTLTKAERNYCVTRRELLAVVFYVRYFRPYLYGRHFTIRTDHGSLRWLLNFRNPEGQIARWTQILGEYDYEIIHRPGRSHQNADSLSRRPCPQCNMSVTEDEPLEMGDPTTEAGSDYVSRSRHNTELVNEEEGNEETVPERSDPELNIPCATADKSRKSVHRKADSELAEVYCFENDPSERVNTRCKMQGHPSSRKAHVSCGAEGDDKTALDGKSEYTKPRVPKSDGNRKIRAVIPTPRWTPEEMKEAQGNDPDMKLLIKAKQDNKRPKYSEVSQLSKAAKVYWMEWNRMELREGLLLFCIMCSRIAFKASSSLKALCLQVFD